MAGGFVARRVAGRSADSEISELARLVASRVEHRLADLHRGGPPDFMRLVEGGARWCTLAPRTRRPLSDRRGKVMRNKEVSGRAGHPSRRQVIALRGARFRCGV